MWNEQGSLQDKPSSVLDQPPATVAFMLVGSTVPQFAFDDLNESIIWLVMPYYYCRAKYTAFRQVCRF